MKGKDKSTAIKKDRFGWFKNKLSSFTITAAFAGRMRWILFVAGFILLYLAFQVGDDWFVRDYANYDWARSIGF